MAKEAGHAFLKRLGKNKLRPGGVTGTQFLMDHIDWQNATCVLEVACNRGLNLLKLASEHPTVQFYGVDMDQEAIDQANQVKAELGLTNVCFAQGNALHLDFPDEQFDYLINEAMLTMLPVPSKERILTEYYRVLKTGGVLLTHDIVLLSDYEATRQALSRAININVWPLPKLEWETLFATAGFATEQHLSARFTLLTLSGLIKDEGWRNSLRIIKNGFKRENRQQFWTMYSVMNRLKDQMHFICYVNRKV